MTYYYTNVRHLTADDYSAAGELAAATYSDSWFAVDVRATEGSTDRGTVFVEYQGIEYEVWLDRTWTEAQEKYFFEQYQKRFRAAHSMQSRPMLRQVYGNKGWQVSGS